MKQLNLKPDAEPQPQPEPEPEPQPDPERFSILISSNMHLFRKKRTNRIHATTQLLGTKQEQEFLRLEAERREFVRCSGMHTQEVRAIVEAVCKKEWSMTTLSAVVNF